MTLTFYGHPLSSFCWKAMIALRETGADFGYVHVDGGDLAQRTALLAVSPLGKLPALQDGDLSVYESTTVIEHLARRFPEAGLIPESHAAEVRHWDRMFDLYAHTPMFRLVGYMLRPDGNPDRFGVAREKAEIATFYDLAERHLAGRTWAAGAGFSMADCSAQPALHYANKIVPLGEAHPNLRAYLARLEARPSITRVLRDAEPYAHLFPGAPAD